MNVIMNKVTKSPTVDVKVKIICFEIIKTITSDDVTHHSFINPTYFIQLWVLLCTTWEKESMANFSLKY